MPLNLIESRRLYQAVADQIAQMIRADEFRPGDRLPTERDLVRQLGVSRPVIREAMIALEIGGLVEVRGGSGVYVCARAAAGAPAGANPAPPESSAFDLFAARVAVEVEVAAVAAENATRADLTEMEAAIEQMRLAARTGRSTKPANERFHLIWDEMPKRGPISAKLDARRLMRPTRVSEHEVILRAVAARDADRARAATRAHLQAAIKDYLDGTPPNPSDREPQIAQEAGR